MFYGRRELTLDMGELEQVDEPSEVKTLRQVIMRLPGVLEVGVSPTSLVGLDVRLLSLADLADLPIGAIRRTMGGLPGESVIQVWLSMDRTEEAWVSLEFLAWCVRDESRGGSAAQMRVLGLPPRVADHVQIGSTLAFVIEWFIVHPKGDAGSLLGHIREEGERISLLIDLYQDLLAPRKVVP